MSAAAGVSTSTCGESPGGVAGEHAGASGRGPR